MLKLPAMNLLLVTSFACLLLHLCGAQTCPDGWRNFEKSCYLYVDEHCNWLDAKAICEALRSSLVEISSSEENSFVASIVQLHNDRSVWCGLQDLAEDGHFVWTSSLEKPDYINWVPDQPDEDGGNEDCVEVLNNGQWNDEQCVDYRSYPLCEQPAVGEPIG
ncbi:low affinity immunoglobulin epsilon Fc receptor-like [Pomacea canaliculata]|uniref:low affinity immunoglobulin epsilon Fc receptor-like n=1 Tax=Pomacea canaliculata TaxID=400727 RepID=UPI000D72B9FE|nr:low affinity immunoglobulin epsilon Fc receptor-like [Pomacea canaliculata]